MASLSLPLAQQRPIARKFLLPVASERPSVAAWTLSRASISARTSRSPALFKRAGVVLSFQSQVCQCVGVEETESAEVFLVGSFVGRAGAILSIHGRVSPALLSPLQLRLLCVSSVRSERVWTRLSGRRFQSLIRAASSKLLKAALQAQPSSAQFSSAQPTSAACDGRSCLPCTSNKRSQ